MLHLLALLLSVAGALCISQPQFLFGDVGEQQSPLGYCLAMMSGCFQACSFVCARKSAHISVSLLAFVTLLFAVPAALLPPIFRVGGATNSFEPVLEKPWQAVGLLCILTVWTFFSILLPAAGATRCPAAVSATVFTSSSMITGYVAQTILFGNAPKPLKLLGAGCMLLSVVMMAIRCHVPEPEEACTADTAGGAEVVLEPGAAEDDETLSLGSFVASEISFTSSSRSLRRRSTAGSANAANSAGLKPVAQRLGACLPIAVTSA